MVDCTATGPICQPVVFTYDADKVLTSAGPLSLARDPQKGLLAGSAVGSLTVQWSYNGLR